MQGEYCHVCGQSVHDPIRHIGHAVEEFFEAFWHLDGRLFRTLRDLSSPGRVAINYLAGHRARYIAPLRLFVVLSVLTFFVGAASVHLGEDALRVDGLDGINAATTVEEVELLRDQAVAGIQQARADAGNTPGVDPTLIAAEARIRGAAANRVVELTGSPATDAAGNPSAASDRPRLRINLFGHRGEWDAKENPLVIGWWPGFANDWLNRRIGNLEKNMQSMDVADTDAWLQGIMSAAPSALFLLVPVFALLLKIAYLFTGRLYLEHLVVALYSHVFLLLMLLLAFVISALDGWFGAGAAGIALDLALAAVLVWMPVYLLLMQKRVYRQSWWLTGLKYLVIGNIYFVMLAVATLLVFLGRLASA
nr:DUF3667 domain-containing protein [Lysobacter sp. GX 14042]